MVVPVRPRLRVPRGLALCKAFFCLCLASLDSYAINWIVMSLYIISKASNTTTSQSIAKPYCSQSSNTRNRAAHLWAVAQTEKCLLLDNILSALQGVCASTSYFDPGSEYNQTLQVIEIQ